MKATNPHTLGSRAAGAARRLGFALLALIVTAAAVVVVALMRPAGEGITVVATEGEVTAGRALTASELRLVTVPESAVPVGAAESLQEVVGSRPLISLPAGTVVSSSLLEGESGENVPDGFARVSVEVDESDANLAPGDRVELWGPGNSCADTDCPLLRLSQGVSVVAVETPSSSVLGGEASTNIVLMVPANDVGTVLRAAEARRLHFVLR